ncbi:MAG: N-methyl-L-tryptophan oxidase [Phototrophicaceae bacterium]
MTVHYDVIVVGLGAMGSATSYQLAQQGAKVLGLDRFHPPHEMGSSHGETRITRLAVGEGEAYIPLVRRSHAIWRDLEARTEQSVFYETGGYIMCPRDGKTSFHGTSNFVQATATLANQYDIPHELLDAPTVRARHPMINLPNHMDTYYEPSSGLVLPHRAVALQLQVAQQLGATLRMNEPMLDYHYTPDGVTVRTAHDTYHADRLVISSGAWFSECVPPSVAEHITVLRQTLFWFEVEDLPAFSFGRFPFLIWIGDQLEDFFSVFTHIEGGLPAIKMLTEQFIETTSPHTVNRTVSEEEIESFYHTHASKNLHGIKRNCLHSAACLYTMTTDDHFILDWHPESERVLLVSACSGHGFKHSAAVGLAAAELTLHGRTTFDVSPFRLNRFSPA